MLIPPRLVLSTSDTLSSGVYSLHGIADDISTGVARQQHLRTSLPANDAAQECTISTASPIASQPEVSDNTAQDFTRASGTSGTSV